MSDERVNINKAGVSELAELPGIGEVLAQRIVEHRHEKPFSDITELKAVAGISDRTLEELKDRLIVGEGEMAIHEGDDEPGSEPPGTAGEIAEASSAGVIPTGELAEEQERAGEPSELPTEEEIVTEGEAEPEEEVSIVLEPSPVGAPVAAETIAEDTRTAPPVPAEEPTRPSFFSRLGGFLWRLFLAFVKIGIIFLIVFVLAAIGWIIYREIDRSFDSVTTRMDSNTGRIGAAEGQINSLLSDSTAQQNQLQALQTAVASQENSSDTLSGEFNNEQDRQDEMLSMLQTRLTALITRTSAISSSVASVEEDVASLQTNVGSSASEIDALGGELDTLQTEIDSLNEMADAMQLELSSYSADEFMRMRQALSLFRLWELVSRARLHLLDQNLGLAADQIEGAIVATENYLILFTVEGEPVPPAIQEIRQRLNLAASNLTANQIAAARDLETAWELLDGLLAELFGEQPIPPQVPETPTPTAAP